MREERNELEQESENLKCLISDLNEIWLPIILDNGEECTKNLTAKNQALEEKAESLSKALRTRQNKGAHLGKIAAFWNIMVEEEAEMRRPTTIQTKAKSCCVANLLQGLQSQTSQQSTQASSTD